MFLRSYCFVGIIEAIISTSVFFMVFYRAGIDFSTILAHNMAIINGTADIAILNTYVYATTMALASIIFCQIGNLFACRSERKSFVESLKSKNKLIIYGILTELAILALIVYVPFFQTIFHTAPLTFNDCLLLLICPVIILFFEEIRKLIVNMPSKKRFKKYY